MTTAELKEGLEAKKNELLELEMKEQHLRLQRDEIVARWSVVDGDWVTAKGRINAAQNEVAALEMAVNLTTQ